MPFSTPNTWSAAVAAVADFNTYIRDQIRWLGGHSAGSKPYGIVSLSTPTALTTGAFTFINHDTVMGGGGGFSGGGFVVPSGGAGMYSFTATTYTAAGQGNKELRIARNADEADYCAAQNQYGVATPAVSGLCAAGRFVLAVGDAVDVALFMDDPSPFNVVVSIFSWCWEATDL